MQRAKSGIDAMVKKTRVTLDLKKLKESMVKNTIEMFTANLIDYAKEEIQKIGDKINTYNSKNHMDRSGNLLNSLCWGVAYDGKLADSGFYRDETLKEHYSWFEGRTKKSYLHEWMPEYEAFEVNGRKLAEDYIKRYGTVGSDGGYWRVFFAILAPYWGYWEKGFNLVHGKGVTRTTSFKQFAVMTQFYDSIKSELEPMKVKFDITDAINYTKPYFVRGIKGYKGRVRGSIERQYDNWSKKQKRI